MTPAVHGWTSDLAIDNIASIQPDLCTCCSATDHESPWWQIDLGNEYSVEAIEVLSRGDITGKVGVLANHIQCNLFTFEKKIINRQPHF